jgi:integrase
MHSALALQKNIKNAVFLISKIELPRHINNGVRITSNKMLPKEWIKEALRFKAEDIDGNLITLWTRKSKNSNLTPRRIPKPDCLIGFTGKGKVFEDWESYPRFLEDLTDNWNWHNLRHRRASIWANNGLTTFEIMVRLGHSNLSTTMKYLQLLGFTRL